MTPEQVHAMTGFAAALSKLKAKDDLGEGCELTHDEVAGIIWGIKQLRGGVPRDAASQPA